MTGGIGSGKSTVSDLLQQKGARVIDADVVAKQIVEPGRPAHDSILKRFGDSVTNADGSINRARLAGIVFSDPVARGDLEQITHPLIRDEIVSLLAEGGPHEVTIIEAALLVEVGERWRRSLELSGLIVVASAESKRIQRLVEYRGMKNEEAMARIESQRTDHQRLREADYVIENNGSMAELRTAVNLLWEQLRAPLGVPERPQ